MDVEKSGLERSFPYISRLIRWLKNWEIGGLFRKALADYLVASALQVIGVTLLALLAFFGIGNWTIKKWLRNDDYIYLTIPHYIKVAESVEGRWAFGKGDYESSKTVSVHLVTIDNPPYFVPQSLRDKSANLGPEFASGIRDPKLNIRAVRFPGPKLDKSGAVIPGVENWSWYLDLTINHRDALKLGGLPILELQQGSLGGRNSSSDEYGELNCRFRFDWVLVESSRNSKLAEMADLPALDSNENLLVVRIRYSTADRTKDQGCDFV
jgi:hypothetical protein